MTTNCFLRLAIQLPITKSLTDHWLVDKCNEYQFSYQFQNWNRLINYLFYNRLLINQLPNPILISLANKILISPFLTQWLNTNSQITKLSFPLSVDIISVMISVTLLDFFPLHYITLSFLLRGDKTFLHWGMSWCLQGATARGPITEVKQLWACLVIGWVTVWDTLVAAKMWLVPAVFCYGLCHMSTQEILRVLPNS